MQRDGERRLAVDPGETAGDGHLVFIGRVRSPWMRREDCPKNRTQALETGRPASIELYPDYRAGLKGLRRASHLIVLTWLNRATRDLIVQAPRHASAPSGVFALRSPVRPNPIGLHVAKILAIDTATGLIEIDAVDALDGTPVIDLKPYYASVDSIPDATVANP